MTLVELITAMFIMFVLMGVAAVGVREMRNKSAIDEQSRELYADLMRVRTEALFRKEVRSVKLTGTSEISVYATSDASGAVLWRKSYSKGKAIVSNNDDPLVFDSQGVGSTDKAYCVGGADNGAGIDSVAINSTSLLLGKLNGGTCSSGNIYPK